MPVAADHVKKERAPGARMLDQLRADRKKAVQAASPSTSRTTRHADRLVPLFVKRSPRNRKWCTRRMMHRTETSSKVPDAQTLKV